MEYTRAEAVNTIIGLADYLKEYGMHSETFIIEVNDVLSKLKVEDDSETEDEAEIDDEF